MCATKIVLNFR